ncbi:hypothetical protein FACS18948_4520 [Clostridia bacterium]|nr:hypothetical protein FACS18948_4520 [Clostridia bacterium]
MKTFDQIEKRIGVRTEHILLQRCDDRTVCSLYRAYRYFFKTEPELYAFCVGRGWLLRALYPYHYWSRKYTKPEDALWTGDGLRIRIFIREFKADGDMVRIDRLDDDSGNVVCYCVTYRRSGNYFTTEAEANAYCVGRRWLAGIYERA